MPGGPGSVPPSARGAPAWRRVGAFFAPATHRRPSQSRRSLVVALLAFALAVTGVTLVVPGGPLGRSLWDRTAGPARWSPASEASASTEPSVSAQTPLEADASPSPATPKRAPVDPLSLPGGFPVTGPGTFTVHGSPGAVLGRSGALRRFQVAIEHGVPEDLGTFAATIDATLGDPRSWPAGQRVRFQRVGRGSAHDLTIYLVTEATAHRMCAAGGVDIRVGGRPYTSCRATGKVIINLSRWRLSAPPYVAGGVPLAAYRQYVINHEIGHELGYGHERCPGPGRPAPVMLKQTLGLGGCTANPWPYVDGKRYVGPPG